MERDSLALEIVDTARALRRAFDQRAAAIGVTRAQWRVLAKLARNPGLKQVALAELLEIEPITLSRHLDRLQEAGLVERMRDPEDRRAWRLELTAKAGPIVGRLRELATGFAADAFGGLSNGDAERLSAMLADVRGRLARADNEFRTVA